MGDLREGGRGAHVATVLPIVGVLLTVRVHWNPLAWHEVPIVVRHLQVVGTEVVFHGN